MPRASTSPSVSDSSQFQGDGAGAMTGQNHRLNAGGKAVRPAEPDKLFGLSGEETGDRGGDRLFCGVLVESKAGRGIDLKAKPFARRGAAEVDAGNGKLKRCGKMQTTGSDFIGKSGAFDLRREAGMSGVTIVVSLAKNTARKEFLAHNVDAVVVAGNELLELSWTPTNVFDAFAMRGSEARNYAADTADGFVDDRTVFFPKGEGGVWVGGDQSVWNRKAAGLNLESLEGFRAIGSHGGGAIDDPGRSDLRPTEQRVGKACKLDQQGAAGRKIFESRQLARLIGTNIGGSDIRDFSSFSGVAERAGNFRTDRKINGPLGGFVLVEKKSGNTKAN